MPDPMTAQADAGAVSAAWERILKRHFHEAASAGVVNCEGCADLALVQAAHTEILADAKLIVDAFAVATWVPGR